MQKTGRKSGVIATVAAAPVAVDRPNPPLELTPEESDVWQETVDAMPADWFPKETHSSLVQYCRHVIAARRVAQLLDAECAREDVDVERLNKLMIMQERESRIMSSLATRMRLTQQSSYSDKAANGKKERRATTKRPWE